MVEVIEKLEESNKNLRLRVFINLISRFYNTIMIDYKDIIDYTNILIKINSELISLVISVAFSFI